MVPVAPRSCEPKAVRLQGLSFLFVKLPNSFLPLIKSAASTSMYCCISALFVALSNTLPPSLPPTRRLLYVSTSFSIVCFLCSFRTLSTDLIVLSWLSVKFPALTAPSLSLSVMPWPSRSFSYQGIGLARILFCRECR